jgi:predicted site-specific integrase-resolvase
MHYLTGNQAAALLGISRKTLYRWHHEGRLLSTEWTLEQINARKHELAKRPRGPRRNPASRRYTIGRHRFEQDDGRAAHTPATARPL